jgi:hypothetical protein
MMEAARTSETLVNFYQTTRCYNPEDSNLYPILFKISTLYRCFSETLTSTHESTRRHNQERHRHPQRCENFKSHKKLCSPPLFWFSPSSCYFHLRFQYSPQHIVLTRLQSMFLSYMQLKMKFQIRRKQGVKFRQRCYGLLRRIAY